MINRKLDDVYRKIGYTFTDENLLVQALTHRSCGASNNERLEFLGDSILNFCITQKLYEQFPNAKEGELSRLRASLVKGETLAEIAKQWALGESLLLGEGELKSGGYRRPSILADAVEAILGAIYVEAGFDQAFERVGSWYHLRLNNLTLEAEFKDPKTRLQEWLQARRLPLPVYTVEELNAPGKELIFKVQCKIKPVSTPTSAQRPNRKQAEKAAAELMLAQLNVGGNKNGH